VALAAIQALYEVTQADVAQIDDLDARLTALEKQNNTITAGLPSTPPDMKLFLPMVIK
jgi:hypothetical protein